LRIPDVWHVARRANSKEDRELIIECWHLAHDLRSELINRQLAGVATNRALTLAERFVRGFEGDPAQHGVGALLKEIRAALSTH
jgi:hypothetical protein